MSEDRESIELGASGWAHSAFLAALLAFVMFIRHETMSGFIAAWVALVDSGMSAYAWWWLRRVAAEDDA